jgi:hypothetical protein
MTEIKKKPKNHALTSRPRSQRRPQPARTTPKPPPARRTGRRRRRLLHAAPDAPDAASCTTPRTPPTPPPARRTGRPRRRLLHDAPDRRPKPSPPSGGRSPRRPTAVQVLAALRRSESSPPAGGRNPRAADAPPLCLSQDDAGGCSRRPPTIPRSESPPCARNRRPPDHIAALRRKTPAAPGHSRPPQDVVRPPLLLQGISTLSILHIRYLLMQIKFFLIQSYNMLNKFCYGTLIPSIFVHSGPNIQMSSSKRTPFQDITNNQNLGDYHWIIR